MIDMLITLAKLEALSEADFDNVAKLATTIWRAHYAKIISMAQIDYMLKARYSPAALRIYLNSADRWFELLRVDKKLAGYCSYSRSSNLDELKLEQLYLLDYLRGKGLGKTMLGHIEAAARKKKSRVIILQVNKQNSDSIAFYGKAGFRIREEATFDIGNGYVMDDYIMEKQLN